MSTYTYSLSNDFGGNLNINQLTFIIENDSNITKELSRIDTKGDVVDIIFTETLPSGEESILNNLISTYDYKSDPRVELTTSGDFGTTLTITGNPTTNNRIITMPNSTSLLAKSYDVIVDINGGGDFSSISAAFAAGKNSVFVKNGTYVEMTDINIPDRGKLVGEANGKVIIYFIGPYSLKSDGSNGVKELNGTFSITNGSANIVGLGTNFTNLSPGQFVLIGNNTYTIASIADDTNLTLTENYNGKSISNKPFAAQSMNTGINISNLIISNSSSTGLYLRAIRHSTISYVAVDSCTAPIELIDSIDTKLDTLIASNGDGVGLRVSFCVDTLITTTNIYNNNGNGLQLDSNCLCLILEGCSVTCNNGNGFYFTGNSDCVTFNDCISKQNNQHGVCIDSSATNIIVENIASDDNNGHGIYVDSSGHIISSCVLRNNTNCGLFVKSNCVVNGNICRNNGNHGICVNTATYCSIVGNLCYDNTNNGINCIGDNNTVSNNSCYNNSGNGMEFTVDSENNLILGNQIRNNSGSNLVDNGTGNISQNNITI